MITTAPAPGTSVTDLVLGLLPNGVSVPTAGLRAVAVLFVVLACVGLVVAGRLVLAFVLAARAHRAERRPGRHRTNRYGTQSNGHLEARLQLAIREAMDDERRILSGLPITHQKRARR